MKANEVGTMRTDSSPADEPLVCRRVVSRGVVVATLHPVVGPVYWRFVDESGCNAPDYYGVTDNLELATVFKSGYYEGSSFQSFRSSCLDGLSETQYDWDERQGAYDFIEKYCWEVRSLAAKAGCTPDEFTLWLLKAVWVEYPAPVKIYYLSDFNGFVGYRPEWSENVEDASQWSGKELADKDDVDAELARSIGHFVPLSQAAIVTPAVRHVSRVNNALEADCALTLHRLRVASYRDGSRSARDSVSWLGDWQETAWIYAARAGVDHVRGGEILPVTGHIAPFPDLLARFDMAAALARHEALQQQGP